MLTQDDLNMIKERAEKVTHGPWYADAEFIAHAREDIPRLVAEVERLRKAIVVAERELWWGSPESACIRVSDLLKDVLESDLTT